MSKITASRLEAMLHYDPETGVFTWVKAPNHNSQLTGKQAGHLRPDGYRKIRIGGIAYYTSHLACVWILGKWPDEEMDHIDRDPSNDRWSNLREATSSLNKRNQGRWLGSELLQV